MTEHRCHTVLIVGVGDSGPLPNANIVENLITVGRRVVAGVNMEHKSSPYPFVLADGRRLPFADRAVDFALANAIIEHVGDASDQAKFVAEHARVARCWAITTPNKWFPVESHTSTLFLHWLPHWRKSRSEFTRLLSLREFRYLLPPGTHVVGRPWSATFTALYGN